MNTVEYIQSKKACVIAAEIEKGEGAVRPNAFSRKTGSDIGTKRKGRNRPPCS
jgi:hypothetical protein